MPRRIWSPSPITHPGRWPASAIGGARWHVRYRAGTWAQRMAMRISSCVVGTISTQRSANEDGKPARKSLRPSPIPPSFYVVLPKEDGLNIDCSMLIAVSRSLARKNTQVTTTKAKVSAQAQDRHHRRPRRCSEEEQA